VNEKNIVAIILSFVILLAVFCSGCTTRSPVIVDTGDIDKLRYEYKQLREEYNRLQSDYRQLTDDSKFYADYYRHTTETIGRGLEEIGELGNSSAGEISKLRSYIAVIRNIIKGIIAGQQREGQQDSQVDGNEQ